MAAESTSGLDALELRSMTPSDLHEVLEIERTAFATPWQAAHFLHEIENNRWAVNLVVVEGGAVIGYACLWCIHEELKINNIAVREDRRGHGVGRWLLRAVLDEGLRRGCEVASLEVRPSNHVARSLYRSHGFAEVGRRPNYYAEGEDAILMTLGLERRRGGATVAEKPRGV